MRLIDADKIDYLMVSEMVWNFIWFGKGRYLICRPSTLFLLCGARIVNTGQSTQRGKIMGKI